MAIKSMPLLYFIWLTGVLPRLSNSVASAVKLMKLTLTKASYGIIIPIIASIVSYNIENEAKTLFGVSLKGAYWTVV